MSLNIFYICDKTDDIDFELNTIIRQIKEESGLVLSKDNIQIFSDKMLWDILEEEFIPNKSIIILDYGSFTDFGMFRSLGKYVLDEIKNHPSILFFIRSFLHMRLIEGDFKNHFDDEIPENIFFNFEKLGEFYGK